MRRECPTRRMILPLRHPERSRGTPDSAFNEVHDEHRVTEGTSILPPMPCNGLSKGENTIRGVVAASKDSSDPQVRGRLRGHGISELRATHFHRPVLRHRRDAAGVRERRVSVRVRLCSLWL